MNHEEDRIQAACVRWFAYQYPQYVLYSIPNGGKRNALEAVRLKKTGVVAGIPDLMLAVPVNGYSGMFIEMKSTTGRLSDNQKSMLAYLESIGYKTAVCKSLDEFIETVERYLNTKG